MSGTIDSTMKDAVIRLFFIIIGIYLIFVTILNVKNDIRFMTNSNNKTTAKIYYTESVSSRTLVCRVYYSYQVNGAIYQGSSVYEQGYFDNFFKWGDYCPKSVDDIIEVYYQVSDNRNSYRIKPKVLSSLIGNSFLFVASLGILSYGIFKRYIDD